MTHDGRDFLTSAVRTERSGEVVTQSSTRATYGSDGMLHRRSIERRPTPASPRGAALLEEGDDYVFHFAGRPVAQWRLGTVTAADGDVESIDILIFLHTDHLATPILATDAAGNELWRGGFEPFGVDYNGAAEAGIFVRMPGQWQDATWSQNGDGETLYYNVHRWYAPDTGKYTRPDPIGLRGGVNVLAYVFSNPVSFVDPDGRRTIVFAGCDVFFLDDENNQVRSCSAGSGFPGADHTHQDKKNIGPIPEGEWSINPREFSGGWLKDMVRDPGWGKWRAPIHPEADTVTYGRDGFFLHGENRENRPGSAGCVDIGDCDSWARDWAMEAPDKPIKFIVNYAQARVCN